MQTKNFTLHYLLCCLLTLSSRIQFFRDVTHANNIILPVNATTFGYGNQLLLTFAGSQLLPGSYLQLYVANRWMDGNYQNFLAPVCSTHFLDLSDLFLPDSLFLKYLGYATYVTTGGTFGETYPTPPTPPYCPLSSHVVNLSRTLHSHSSTQFVVLLLCFL
jgi:hypothetical protein